ncbi:serine hydrolase [Maribacter halichondriae]|uniref:serine hydrolase n=1 Tax=Maribacter halichondriae TaxID=2980554 RepID=UPI0023583F67|nr:serine hydrolase [Maribacter sp. Hal144]
MKKTFLVFLTVFLLVNCTDPTASENPLEIVLASENKNIKRVVDSVDQFEVQIRFTQIDRRNDSVLFTDYDFQVDKDNYFYPASTVKFPVAVLALEKLNAIDTLDRNTRFYVEGDSVETTFAKAISEIFAVSDNIANNRLVEFLGQDAMNAGLEKRGVQPVRIAHRLGYHSDDVSTKPLIIYLNDSTTATFAGTINTSAKPLQLNRVKKGTGYLEEDSLIQEPFDFSLKNYYPIDAQHGLLKRVIFPEKFPENQRFDLSEEQREFLLSAMHTLPKELGYDPKEYYDGYCKFFMYGDTKEDMPDHIKIYNKVGWAYGTLTDCAFVVDDTNDVEFMLTATLLVNKNGIFNDDTYEFEEVGIPFLAELGREIYKQELNRKK